MCQLWMNLYVYKVSRLESAADSDLLSSSQQWLLAHMCHMLGFPPCQTSRVKTEIIIIIITIKKQKLKHEVTSPVHTAFSSGNIALLFHHTACIKVRGGMGGQFRSASDTPADVVTDATEASLCIRVSQQCEPEL